ncbi:TadE/TadG family type IV pilus assembly protein [Novosphingobium sp. RD2P27]|uniref:TadE/TadG family type IV pilus assembly protein n=1 Tax=Novosphingobium kalidii TaxID=3230299 RepID=A0ABV2D078_9SPHN
MLRQIRQEERGATIIEFAIVAPAFIALLLAIIQTSIIYFVQHGLETAAEKAARIIYTGQVQKQGLTASAYKTQVCEFLPAFLSCDSLFIDVRHTIDFASAGTATPTLSYDASGNPSNIKFDPGTAGAIVVTKLMYQWPVLGAPLNLGVSKDSSGKHIIVATQVSKTEPY